MAIQPVVIGTAGHIDHGKSTLVRVLTGVDPDRLAEEKERGLTIDLGFAPLDLPDGRKVGIVDVPGHERFVRNMVAGASGVDLALLVVAADDGVMPQTREHVQILELLGVRRGLVALTKIDAVEPELVELAREDVRSFLAGTCLERAPLVQVSASTGEGLDALRAALWALAAETEPRSAEGLFRMPVQRVFSLAGRGTVLTGIPVSGSVSVGETLEVLTAGERGSDALRGKVRGIQAYREETDTARAGHSTALNLSDVERRAVARGDVVATPGAFRAVRMVAVRFTALLDLARPVAQRSAVRMHTGTADPRGELVLLDAERVEPGATALAQVRLSEPVVCAPGDRFVLRLCSPVETLGGGVVLEESRHRLKPFKRFVLEELASQERSLASPNALLESELARRGGLVPTEALASAIKRSAVETGERLSALASRGRALDAGRGRWIHVDALGAARARLRAALDAWFAEHSHRAWALVLELRRALDLSPELFDAALEHGRASGELVLGPGGRVGLAERRVEVGERERELDERVQAALEQGGLQPPSTAELASSLALPGPELTRALERLIDAGRVVRVGPELVFAASALARARDAVVENCERHGKLEIPALRDALGTTRKFLIPLLEHFDARGVTLRQGAHRVLRRH